MDRAIHLKSVAIGGLLVVVVIGAMGAVPDLHRDTYGRFSMAVTPTGGAYLLDTATGQVWSTAMDSWEFYVPKTYDDPNRVPVPTSGALRRGS
jgi:hypothetical protein